MKRISRIVLLGLLLTAQGCGDADPEAVQTDAAAGSDGFDAKECAPAAVSGSVMRRALAAAPTDYAPVDGPEELFGLVDILVDGTITNIAEGRVIGAVDDGPTHHVVITIEPTRVYKAPGGKVPDAVHIEFSRPDNWGASTWRDAIPNGTRIVMFGHRANRERLPVRHEFAGRTKGSPLYHPAPQGFFMAVDEASLPRGFGNPDLGIDGFTDLSAFEEIGSGCTSAKPDAGRGADGEQGSGKGPGAVGGKGGRGGDGE